ncbi:DUF3905 domain-containing protein [Halalkalibacter urbisdiaboli]|uniref:DUF3905 domain-containing protein n=1 Tax=Halalkalibacter urbisdiaboli TaxID=1960589 RepID=UPI000B43C955|nr:DUF3905 domain-containing protein [Halalkalibacter urbisdiaboli]
MKNKKQENRQAEQTPLDYWDETIDPATMSGDHWVESNLKAMENQHDPAAMFMHPTQNSEGKGTE